MPKNIVLNEEDFEQFGDINNLKVKTREDRDRHMKYFWNYNEENLETDANDLRELFSTMEGREKFIKHLSAFFTLHVKGDDWPKLGYVKNIRTSRQIRTMAVRAQT